MIRKSLLSLPDPKSTKPGKDEEIQITDALCEEAKKGMVIAYNFQGKRFDCGSVDGFVEATNYFYDLEKGKRINE